jgi:hypothetical protein
VSVSNGQKANESLLSVLWANTWALNFILFALLADIAYRSVVYQEPAWDLVALIGTAGVILIGYAVWHRVPILQQRGWFVLALTAVVAAVTGAVLALLRAM